MRQYPAASDSDIYNIKNAMFNYGKLEEFFKMMNNFKTAIDGTGNTTVYEKTNYLYTILRIEALQELDLLTSQVMGTTNTHITFIKAGLIA